MSRFLTAILTFATVASLGAQRSSVAPNRSASPANLRLIARLGATNVSDVLEGAISPDGRSFAFVKSDHSNQRLWVLDVASGRTRLLTPRFGARIDPRWSLDGKRIAFWGSVALPGHSESVAGTWIVDVATGAEQLAFAAGDFGFTPNPTWTRDGRLVFVEPIGELTAEGVAPTWGLRIVDSRTGATTRLTPTGLDLEYPAVSPDGRQVAYLGHACAPGMSALYLAPIANNKMGEPRCVGSVASLSPVWSADSRRVYVVAAHARGDRSHILMIDAASGRQDTVSLTGVGPDIREISVTADDHLVIVARSGFARVGIVPARGGTPVALQSDTTLDTALPVWSTDGATIAARASSRTSLEQAEIVPVTIATHGPGGIRGGIERHPRGDIGLPPKDSLGMLAWSPDGRCVVDEALSRDSLVVMRPSAPRKQMFAQAPTSYSESAFPNDMSIYDAATQWTRDGTRVLKQSWGHFYVIARDTTKSGDCVAGAPHRVALRGFAGRPLGWRLSPDGRTIAFSRAPGRDTSAGIFIAPIDGGAVTQLRDLPSDASGGGPEWTADGRGLFFADADSTGHYGILRLTLATGVVDTITRGPMNAMHPRLSPDGRQLAVTMTDVTTAVWEMRLSPAHVGSALAADAADTAHAAREIPLDTANRPDARLLNLVERLAARGPDLDGVWPGYWQADQSYALYLRRGMRGTLLVAREPFVSGFRELAIAHPEPWALHVYWRAGPPIRLSGLGIPSASIDSLPAPTADSLALVRWRERTLSSLFLGDPPDPFDGTGKHWDPPIARERPRLPQRWAAVCPNGLPSSCAAVQRVERRALSSALAAPVSQTAAWAREYVAVRWLRRGSGFDASWGYERTYGTSAYAARRASLLAAGGDTSGLGAEIAASFNQLPATDTGAFDFSFHRETVTGESLIVLLERLHYDWKTDVSRGDDLLDALQRAVQFDSTRALHIAKRAYDAFGVTAALADVPPRDAAAPQRGPKLILSNSSRIFYYTLLARAIAGDSSPLVVTLPTARDRKLDTARFKIRYAAGDGDSASTDDGSVFLPDAESVVVEANGLRLEVHHVPVVIDPAPSTNATGMEISVFLPDSVAARIRDKRLASTSRTADPDQRVAAPGMDLFFGGGTIVGRPDTYWRQIAVVIAAPPPPRK